MEKITNYSDQIRVPMHLRTMQMIFGHHLFLQAPKMVNFSRQEKIKITKTNSLLPN